MRNLSPSFAASRRLKNGMARRGVLRQASARNLSAQGGLIYLIKVNSLFAASRISLTSGCGGDTI